MTLNQDPVPHPSAPVPLRPHIIDLHAYRPKFRISAPVFDHVRRPEVTSVPTRTLAEVSHFGPCLRLRLKALVGPATHVPGCCCIRPWLAFDGVEKRLWPRVASRSGGARVHRGPAAAAAAAAAAAGAARGPEAGGGGRGGREGFDVPPRAAECVGVTRTV